MSQRAPALLAVGALAAAAALLAVTGGDLASGALRALAVLGVLAGAAFLVRQRRGPGVGEPPVLSVPGRQALGRDTGVAVIAVDRRRILVGFGPSGVTRLAELGPEGGEPR